MHDHVHIELYKNMSHFNVYNLISINGRFDIIYITANALNRYTHPHTQKHIKMNHANSAVDAFLSPWLV